jgi:hypothetical protein
MNVPLTSAFLVLRHPARSLGLETARLAATLVLFLGLRPWLGLLAAPVAYTVTTGVTTVGLVSLVPADARPDLATELTLPLLAVAVCFALSLWLAQLLPPWWALFAGAPAGAGASLLLLRVLGRNRIWPELRTDLSRVLQPA